VTGWFTEDFTLAELKTLRARERLPQLRPGSAKFDGLEPIPTYQEMLDLAKSESRRLGRPIGTYPEMKHPTYFASIGLPLERRLADFLKKNDLDSRTAPVFVQCFAVGALKTFATLSKAPRVFLVSSQGGPADQKTTYREMLSGGGLKQIAAFADGLGPEIPLVVQFEAGPIGGVRHLKTSDLVDQAHAAGLKVHPWTVRAENVFLPKVLQVGTNPADHGDVGALYDALWKTGIDGLFSDFTALNVAARNKVYPG